MSPPALVDEIEIDHPDQGLITVFLKPMTDERDGSLAGFTLQLSGETDHEFAMPSGLQRPGLGEFMFVRLNAKFPCPTFFLVCHPLSLKF